MTEEKKDNLVNLNEIAERKKQEKKQRILHTSFSNLRGKDYDNKLDMMFSKIMELAEDHQNFQKTNNIIMEFVMNELDPEKVKMRAFINEKHNLEELKEGDPIQKSYYVNIELIFGEGEKEFKLPLPEMVLADKQPIQFTNLVSEDIIGCRVGEIIEKDKLKLKIIKSRRTRIDNKVKTEEPTNAAI